MRRMRTAGLAALGLLAAGAAPAAAQKGPVAVLPAHTFKGSEENGPVVTDAVRANLERAGYRVLSEEATAAALRKLNVDITRPQFIPTLTAIGKELGTTFVVYPRIQGVGTGVNTNDKEEFQATIIVNVADQGGKNLYHVNQVGQVFRHPGKLAELAVINKAAAELAAERLLEGFYKRQKQASAAPRPKAPPAAKAKPRPKAARVPTR
jgi:hypothetical protein